MNMTYVRVAFYFLAPILGAIPGITVHEYLVTIDLEVVFGGLLVSSAAVAGIFAKWGKK